MAVTKMLFVRGYLGKLIPYANNPEKTSLENAIDYATNAAKTETTLMQTAMNCEVKTVYEEMLATKRRWFKEGGIQAYHIIQSFAPGETTPHTAHKIGCEFARRLFGECFEVVVATHLDKAHLHNHLVVNSVSFKDGYKYRSDFKAYFGSIRRTSDALCEEYGLSVLDGTRRGKGYGEWKHDNEDHAIWRDVIRRDIDEAIRQSLSLQQFYIILRAQGYTLDVNPNHKYVTVRAPGMKRSVRLTAKSLGADYTPEIIAKRILRMPYIAVEDKKAKSIFLRKPYKSLKLKGLRALYFRYLYELGLIRKKPRRVHMSKELRVEVRKLDGYAARMRLLHDHRLDTLEQLRAHRQVVREEMDDLARERAALHRKKGEADEHARRELSRQTDAITVRLRVLRKEVALCEAMETESVAFKEKASSLHQINRDHDPVSMSEVSVCQSSRRRDADPIR
jgi:hypothetical protein